MPEIGADWRSWWRKLGLGIGLAMMMHLLAMAPGLTNGTTPPNLTTEPVFLDGIYLFDVPGAGNLNAQERARAIETNLNPLVQNPGDYEIEIKNRLPDDSSSGSQPTENPVIFANDRYIMTVTGNDAVVSKAKTPQDQAEIWAATIDETLAEVQIDRREGFWRRTLVNTLAAVLTALGIHWLAGRLWRQWLIPLVNRFSMSPDHVDRHLTGLKLLLRLGLFLIRATVWFSVATYIASLFPVTRRFSYLVFDSLQDGIFARNLTLGDRTYSLFDLLLLLVALLGLLIASSAVTNVLRSRFLRVTGISLASQEAIAILTKYTMILLGSVVILQLWGIDLSSIALVASGLGIGIGFGLQNIVKDFVSGLVMVFDRPVQVGDFVDFGQVKGTVTRIGSRSTEIRTLDHVSIIVPNSRFLESEVVNWSHGNSLSRLQVPVGVAYSADPQAVKKTLLEVCQDYQDVLPSPSPQVFFMGFGDSALNFELMVWITQPHRQVIIKSDLYYLIEAALRHHGIEIPFPQRDLHVRSGSLPIDISGEAQHWLQQWLKATEETNRM
jgi:potassium efflux system protein